LDSLLVLCISLLLSKSNIDSFELFLESSDTVAVAVFNVLSLNQILKLTKVHIDEHEASAAKDHDDCEAKEYEVRSSIDDEVIGRELHLLVYQLLEVDNHWHLHI
jgi:hypothetical protein